MSKKGSQLQIIKLNVGGELFQTTVATVSSCDNMLRHMFTGKLRSHEDAKGHVFIDRSGKHFHSILNYLRDGSVPLPNDPCLLEELRAEAQYYLIEGLVHLCQQALDQEPGRLGKMQKGTSIEDEQQMIIMYSPQPVVRLTIMLLPSSSRLDFILGDENVSIFDKLVKEYIDRVSFIKTYMEPSDNATNDIHWSFYRNGYVLNSFNALKLTGQYLAPHIVKKIISGFLS